MSVSAAQLLRALGAGIIPGAAPSQTPQQAGALDFASLLQRAQAGELSSGRSLQIDHGAEVELTADQLSRLSQAADAAEVAGANKLFAVIDGAGVIIDVPSRTIERSLSLGTGGERVLPADVMLGVDAVAIVPATSDEAFTIEPTAGASLRSTAPLRLSHIENQSLLSRLSQAT